MNSAVLVSTRNQAHTLAPLAMCCDEREIPGSLTKVDSDSRWLGIGTFTGNGQLLNADGTAGTPTELHTAGTIALAIAEGRLLGIVAPESPAEPAVWFAYDTGQLKATPIGSEGLFRKRPRAIRVSGDGCQTEIAHVAKMYGRAAQRKQAGALLAALS